MSGDLGLMEASLIAVGDTDLRPAIFDRFFETFPHHRPAFLNLEASSGRMINETLELMLGLAEGAKWVEVTIVNFVDLHRNYGAFPVADYNAFIDMTLLCLSRAAGDGWSDDAAAAWGQQATALKLLIAESPLFGSHRPA
jgi:hypothetical protein